MNIKEKSNFVSNCMQFELGEVILKYFIFALCSVFCYHEFFLKTELSEAHSNWFINWLR